MSLSLLLFSLELSVLFKMKMSICINKKIQIELWLVTEFHEYGSLFDFLMAKPTEAFKSGALTPERCLRMALSIACGVEHLHVGTCFDTTKIFRLKLLLVFLNSQYDRTRCRNSRNYG